MLYTIPYHKDFTASLKFFFREKGENNLFLVPKYLEKDLKLPIKILSYEDFFHCKSNINKLSETILIDAVLDKESIALGKRKAVKDALKEAFYYGLDPKKLFTFTKDEELFKKIYQEILYKLKEKSATFKIGNLAEAYKNSLSFQEILSNFNRVFALVPNPFSMLFLQLLQKLKVDFIAQAHRDFSYPVTSSHPSFWLHQIKNLGYLQEEINGPNTHSEAFSEGLHQVLLPGQLLYKWQEEKLYPFKEVEEILSSSKGEELFLISKKLSEAVEKKIGIISPDVKKLKSLYKFLQNSIPKARIKLTVPSSALEEPLIKIFFQIIDLISLRPSLDRIFSFAKEIYTVIDCQILFEAEKYLIKLEGLDLNNLPKIEELLIAQKLEGVVDIINKVLAMQDIKKKKKLAVEAGPFAFLLEKEIKHPLMQLLVSHLSHFLSLVSIEKIPQNKLSGFIKLLSEIEEALLLLDNISFNYYKNLLQDLSKRYPITSEEESNLGSEKYIYLTLPHESQDYDLAILCDLKEGFWPKIQEDHYFISPESRKAAGYEKNHLIDATASNFLSTIARSKKSIISRVTEKILLKNQIKREESRFSLLLRTYKLLTKEPFLTETLPKAPVLKKQNSKTIKINLEKKPKSLSSTSLEKLMKNPYLYYLCYILDLKYLPKVFLGKKALPSNRELGSLIHKTIHKTHQINQKDFITYKKTFLDEFLFLLEQSYGTRGKLFFKIWQGRVNFLIKYLHNYNQIAYTEGLLESHSEKIMSNFINLNNGIKIKLQATLDRLDFFPDQLKIIDYKIGQIPSKNQLLSGLKPQLPFEGLLVTLNKKEITLEELSKIEEKNLSLNFIRLTGLATSTGIKTFPFNLDSTKTALIKIIEYFYCEEGSYKATDQYDYYLEGQILGHLKEIEAKI
jgi:hypothetical protein